MMKMGIFNRREKKVFGSNRMYINLNLFNYYYKQKQRWRHKS